jgi:hypothetical protein
VYGYPSPKTTHTGQPTAYRRWSDQETDHISRPRKANIERICLGTLGRLRNKIPSSRLSSSTCIIITRPGEDQESLLTMQQAVLVFQRQSPPARGYLGSCCICTDKLGSGHRVRAHRQDICPHQAALTNSWKTDGSDGAGSRLIARCQVVTCRRIPGLRPGRIKRHGFQNRLAAAKSRIGGDQ